MSSDHMDPGSGQAGLPDIVIAEAPAGNEDVRWCFEQYYAELASRFEDGWDLDRALPLDDDELTPPRGLVLLASQGSGPVGCGAIKLDVADAAEIKRMWVSESVRGQGLGGRLLTALEDRAWQAGRTVARLETNRSLTEAIAMYRGRGYREVPAFNDEAHADHWFEKDLGETGRR